MGSSITADGGDCSHEIKRCLLLGRKATRNLDNILKSRDITLPAKVYIVKTMAFPVVMYGCDKVKVTQLCPTLCDPMDCIVLGILQARILEWVAFPFSRIFPTQVSALQADSLPTEPPGKPTDVGVGP